MPNPSNWRSLSMIALLFAWGLTACGRDSLQRVCTSDDDCVSGRVCYEGACQDPSLVPDMTIGGEDMDPDVDQDPDSDQGPDVDMLPPVDMQPPIDMPPPIMCEAARDCPGGGDPVAEGNRCFIYGCDGDLCASSEVAVECGGGFVQVGCECGLLACEDASDCDGLGCVSGFCQECRSNDHCDELVCGDDGFCTGCNEDLDCTSREICVEGLCEPRPECLIDDDCGDQELCLSGVCAFSPECRQDNDCVEGYECIGNRCYEEICRGPEDCNPGELCDAGICIDPPVTAERCFVATPSQTIAPGQTVRLEAFATDANGNGVAANFVWMTDAPGVVSVAGNTASAQNQQGVARVTAALDNGMPIMCDGVVELSNIGPPPMMGGLRVVVLDAETGAPVQNADVLINQNTLGGTNALGVANFPVPNGEFTISVFSDDHDFVTVHGVRATDIRIPLNRQSGTGPVAGFKGQFDMSQVSTMGDFNLGLAGASIPGGLVNFDLSTLLGDPFETNFMIPGQGAIDFPVPGGLTIYGRVFGLRLNIKRSYYVSSPGGARLGWGLAGKIPVSELISIFQGGGIDSVGEALAVLLPLFNRFDHGVRPMQLTPIPRVVDSADVDGDGNTMEMVPDYDNFPSESLVPSVRQQLITDIGVSNFPSLSDGDAEVAIIVGGTQLNSTGFVPLGISATNDEDGDGRPDVRRLTMAPPYGSLVGGRFALLSIAFRADGFGGGQQGVEFPDEFSVALWNGQTLPTSVQLGTFPSTATVTENPMARSLIVDSPAGPLYRARFVGTDRSWDVWAPGPAGVMGQFNHTFAVPTPPMGRPDIYNNSQKVLLDAIRTQVKIDDLLQPSGLPLYDAALVSTGFARTLVR